MIAAQPTDIEALLEDIYEAALTPSRWRVVLAALAKTTGAKSGMLRLLLPGRHCRQIAAAFQYGRDPHYQTLYRERFVHQDPFVSFLETVPAGQIHATHRGAARGCMDGLKHTPYYSDYMQPQDFWHCLGGFILHESQATFQLGLQRAEGDTPFTDRHLQGVQALVPHLQRAFSISRRIQTFDTEPAAPAEQMLDRLNLGVILLNHKRRVCFINQQAGRLLAAPHCPLNVVGGRLHSNQPSANTPLQHLLKATTDRRPTPHTPLELPSTPEMTLSLTAAPLSPATACPPAQQHRAVAMVFFGPAHADPAERAALAGQLYGLTPAEARVAVAVAEGLSVKAIAERHRTRENTVRTQLKAALQKTDCRRQLELARLLGARAASCC